MVIKPIRNEADLAAVLAELETLAGAPEGSPEGDRLEVLVALVEAYERQTVPAVRPDPRQLVRFYLEQCELDDTALDGVFGSAEARRKAMDEGEPFTLTVIEKLHDHFQIPRELLAPALLPRRAA